MRLDEVLGNCFALLAYGPQAPERLAALVGAPWSSLGVVRVAVLPPGSALRSVPGVTTVTALDRVMESLPATSHGRVLLLRPDHYVAARFDPGDAAARGAVQRLLDASGPPDVT